MKNAWKGLSEKISQMQMQNAWKEIIVKSFQSQDFKQMFDLMWSRELHFIVFSFPQTAQ